MKEIKDRRDQGDKADSNPKKQNRLLDRSQNLQNTLKMDRFHRIVKDHRQGGDGKKKRKMTDKK